MAQAGFAQLVTSTAALTAPLASASAEMYELGLLEELFGDVPGLVFLR